MKGNQTQSTSCTLASSSSSLFASSQQNKHGLVPTKSCLKQPGNKKCESAQKRVWFDEIEIREYPIILGDNPWTTEGVPITISWDYQCHAFLELEYYELFRPKRRTHDELKLPAGTRVEMAIRSGASMEQVVRRKFEMTKIQKQREKSFHKTKWEHLKGGMIKKLSTFQNKNSHGSTARFTKIPSDAPILKMGCANAAA